MIKVLFVVSALIASSACSTRPSPNAKREQEAAKRASAAFIGDLQALQNKGLTDLGKQKVKTRTE